MHLSGSNLFAALPARLDQEQIDILVNARGVRIERILSLGQTSPAENAWYDQDEDEWVLVLQGEARLAFEGEAKPVHLRPGDHLLLPAHCRHRVVWSHPDKLTLWLAVFFTSAS